MARKKLCRKCQEEKRDACWYEDAIEKTKNLSLNEQLTEFFKNEVEKQALERKCVVLGYSSWNPGKER